MGFNQSSLVWRWMGHPSSVHRIEEWGSFSICRIAVANMRVVKRWYSFQVGFGRLHDMRP